MCEETFTDESSIKKHTSSIHAIIKTIQCDLCNRLFTDDGYLTVHITVMHSNIKTFPCDIRVEIFTGEEILNKHIISIHAFINAIQCHLYNKLFNEHGNCNVICVINTLNSKQPKRACKFKPSNVICVSKSLLVEVI